MTTKNTTEAYAIAQSAIADLKSAIHLIMNTNDSIGLKNAEIGRTLGIYAGHIKHEGHISRTLLAIMEKEGVVEQNEETKLWNLKTHP